MKERPILMSPYMVQAILKGYMTQTRRLMKPQPNPGDLWQFCEGKSRYGLPGDRLWVKESYAIAPRSEATIERPLPTILLEIQEIRPERLQDITEEDARAEGVSVWAQAELVGHLYKETLCCILTKKIALRRGEPIPAVASNVAAYAMLWDTLNKDHPWDSNPWVWVVSFNVAKSLSV